MKTSQNVVRLAGAILSVASQLGCSGNAAPPPASPAPSSSMPAPASTSAPSDANANAASSPSQKSEKEVATGDTPTRFQKNRLLGHYSTADGTSGFILDRTASPWRGKLDGTTTVVTLEESNRPRHGITEYRSDDKSIWIRVHNESGFVELFQGAKQHDAVHVVRDADADPLK